VNVGVYNKFIERKEQNLRTLCTPCESAGVDGEELELNLVPLFPFYYPRTSGDEARTTRPFRP
jgi:hypothetical protein